MYGAARGAVGGRRAVWFLRGRGGAGPASTSSVGCEDGPRCGLPPSRRKKPRNDELKRKGEEKRRGGQRMRPWLFFPRPDFLKSRVARGVSRSGTAD